VDIKFKHESLGEIIDVSRALRLTDYDIGVRFFDIPGIGIRTLEGLKAACGAEHRSDEDFIEGILYVDGKAYSIQELEVKETA